MEQPVAVLSLAGGEALRSTTLAAVATPNQANVRSFADRRVERSRRRNSLVTQ